MKAGESISVSGTVSWKTADGWVPVSTGRVNVSACDALDTRNSFDVAPVAADGSVEFPGGHLTPGQIPVEFQFSETGTGNWLTIGDDNQSYWDGEGGYEFEGRLTEPRSGWWRARYPGDPANFQPATSKKIQVP